MLKDFLKRSLQTILGYDNYLFYFSRFKIYTLSKNKYEKEFFEFMNMIPKEGTILDIGANIGITTIPLALKFPNSTVHSFEPIPSNNKALSRVIKYNKLRNVVHHEIALGEENGELKLVVPIINNVRMQGLCHAYVEGLDSDWNKGDIYNIPMKKIDDVEALKKEEKIVAVKIDVENFEYPVLKGARELLLKHNPIIYCELWDNEMRKLTMDLLKDLGYAVKVFKGEELVDFTTQNETNFIFIKP